MRRVRRSCGSRRGATGSAARPARRKSRHDRPRPFRRGATRSLSRLLARLRPVPSRPRSALIFVPRPRAAASPAPSAVPDGASAFMPMVHFEDLDVPFGARAPSRPAPPDPTRNATPSDVLAACSTAMSFAAAAILRSAQSSRPVVPTRIGMPAGDRAIEAGLQARRARRNRPSRRHDPGRSQSPDPRRRRRRSPGPSGRSARKG